MTEGRVAGERNLTGIWNGLYTYPHGESTSFVATLIETAGSLTGTTHEPSAPGDGPETTAFATLTGAFFDSTVTFTKRYDRPTGRKRSPILYEGVLNGDGSEIEGRWTIPRSWSGKFLMIRSMGQEATVLREAFERV
jgi:hypothetical protein